MSIYEHVFQPLDIGSVRLKNRIARGPHNMGLPWVDVSDEMIGYHAARAKGDVALTILGIAGVHPTSPSSIPVMSDSVISGYEKLVAATEPHGMKLFQQLWHSGPARSFPPVQPWSASDRVNPLVGVPPRPMTKAMIDEVVESFAAAARRVQQGGIHGVELHGAHGYLIGQFLSPATNIREDEYGGSLENRTRFLREVIAAMRAETGPDFPIGVRLSSDEQVEGGLSATDTAEIVGAIESSIDFLDLSIAGYYNFSQMSATMESPLGYEMPTSGVVAASTTLPTIVTGKIMTLDVAENILSTTGADMVSMVRPLIADPELVKKAREGRPETVRPCIGINDGCLGKFFSTGRMGCVVNPTVTRETTVPFDPVDRVANPKKIMVVGGGPAGMEAARNLALRGHQVDLYDMARQLGGQIRIAASAPHRADIAAIVAYLSDEMSRLGVRVHLNAIVDPDFILEQKPDEVIIAAGSTPRDDDFQADAPTHRLGRAATAKMSTSWAVFGFGGRVKVGATALVYDDTGGYEAISVAEKLREEGARVTIATRNETLGASVPHHPSTLYPAFERLATGGIDVIPLCTIRSIEDDVVVVRLIGGNAEKKIDAETVVFVGYNTPNRENADELVDAPFPVHVIGDAAGTRSLAHAIEQGSELGRRL